MTQSSSIDHRQIMPLLNAVTGFSSSPQWLTEKQVAKLIGISLSKLRSDRHKCQGIHYIKFGRSVRYSMEDIKAFMESNRITPLQ